jgi:hypothetical protein
LILLAVLAEAAAWLGAAANRTETFAWFRVQAHLGPGGFALALLVGLALAALRPRRIPPAWPGALVLGALFWDVAQAQPDAATWFTLAQQVAREPGVLLRWSSTVWTTEEARFHQPFPLVPAVYGLAFRAFGESPVVMGVVLVGWALALPPIVTWAARGMGAGRPADDRAARLAGWGVLGLPLLQAQQGWLLADLPLCVLLAGAWGALLRVRGRAGALLALLFSLPAALTKVTGIAFVALPALAITLPLPWFFAALSFLAIALLGLRPPRTHAPDHYLSGLLGLGLHLRVGAWVAAFARAPVQLRRAPLRRDDLLLLGVFCAIPALLLYTPVEHSPRYALPIGVALTMATARHAPSVARFLVGSGLVLLGGGYRPIVVHNQAVNLQEATRALVATGVTAIEVRVDAPDTTFPPAALAALVDLYAPVPVRTGPALVLAPPGRKRRWWEFVEAPAWRVPGPADGLLLGLFGADPDRFEATAPEWERVGAVSRFRASSLVLPQEVVLYRRTR